MQLYQLALIAGWVSLAACQVGPRAAMPTPAITARPVTRTATPLPTNTPEALQEPLLTGVHLQGKFEIPEAIQAFAPSRRELDYLIYLPEGYWTDPEKRWPLIYFLHGSGDGEYDSAFVMSYGLPAVLLAGEQPADFPFIVVSPQAFPRSAWWQPDLMETLAALLEEILATYRVDERRVYLTGLSMGGYGAWYLATRHPDRFAAMVSISGSGYRTQAAPDEELLCQLAEVPTWGIHGAQDRISAPGAAERIVSALRETCGGEVRWTLYPDLGHFGAYERAYRSPELYAWLLEHSR